mgnify:FL=1|tara:strand:- start:1227 stop:1916 length:690 start_codon:yes stop_codon:yes gene_type:complete
MGKLVSIFFPVRKGSKRIKNKNIKPIKNFKAGLLEIKVNHLIKLNNIFKKDLPNYKLEVVFSTNCKKTKLFLKKHSWIKVYDRKESLSSDDVLDKLILEVPRICKGDIIFWSHVTSPLFNENLYMSFIKKFIKNTKKFDSAFSASKIESFLMDENSNWLSHNVNKKKWPRTQDLKGMFVVNNAIFASKREVYINLKNRLGKKILPISTPKYYDLDIDCLEDLEILKKLI